jgi:hypothetical protein
MFGHFHELIQDGRSGWYNCAHYSEQFTTIFHDEHYIHFAEFIAYVRSLQFFHLIKIDDNKTVVLDYNMKFSVAIRSQFADAFV